MIRWIKQLTCKHIHTRKIGKIKKKYITECLDCGKIYTYQGDKMQKIINWLWKQAHWPYLIISAMTIYFGSFMLLLYLLCVKFSQMDTWTIEVTKHCKMCEDEHDGECYHIERYYCPYVLDMWHKLKELANE